MDDPNKILAESQSAEALNAVAVAEEARQKAQQAQMHSIVTSAIRDVLSDDTGSPLLIKRIPFICNDIKDMKEDISLIKDIFIKLMWGALTLLATGIFGLFAWVLYTVASK